MIISGILVTANVSKAESVAARINELPGCECHGIHEGGKIIVTIEAESIKESERLAFGLIRPMDGVTGVYVSYCNYEDAVLGDSLNIQ